VEHPTKLEWELTASACGIDSYTISRSKEEYGLYRLEWSIRGRYKPSLHIALSVSMNGTVTRICEQIEVVYQFPVKGIEGCMYDAERLRKFIYAEIDMLVTICTTHGELLRLIGRAITASHNVSKRWLYYGATDAERHVSLMLSGDEDSQLLAIELCQSQGIELEKVLPWHETDYGGWVELNMQSLSPTTKQQVYKTIDLTVTGIEDLFKYVSGHSILYLLT